MIISGSRPRNISLQGLETWPLSESNGLNRFMARFVSVLIAATLHGGIVYWYVNRPVATTASVAMPLPAITMELQSPAAASDGPRLTLPQALPVQEARKAEPEHKKRPKAEKPKRELAVKQKESTKLAPTAPVDPPDENARSMSSQGGDIAGSATTGSGGSGNGVGGGGNYTQAIGDAHYLSNPKPEYPLLARQRQWQGVVQLRVHVTETGKAEEVALEQSSGYKVLDDAALAVVKKWRFIPAKRGNIVEACWVSVPIRFTLD